MRITQLPAENAHELWPLLRVVHDLHVLHQPERNIADPDKDDCIAWLREMLSDPAYVALVARDENAHPMGYVLGRKRRGPEAPVSPPKNHGMIEHISVLPDYHRQGIGRALIDALKEHLADEGYTHMSVTYAMFNEASAALMRSVGLTPKIIYAEGEI
ncbi:GNAT family N-acetyltransferase [Halocynthiibacter styelae]|uniref:GNAT family N-acetyltransferase n=1 Tax=Halocynthiibacter styelae TaxID=2761955 RepID=A0A8J7LQ43_9RHOB|nr:GNAT family N-acetyltransferase [Paenihalocynthiibacter styelae]MBI1494576.1 GNAT family N-acetyltransferase [Paenihalocynthiibacter styelae]